ncbi:MAG: alpha/beta hydrolase [Actinomycetota bacterium]
MNPSGPAEMEAAEFNTSLELLLAGYPRVDTVPPEVSRRAREEGRSWVGELRLSDRAMERSLPTAAGPRRARLLIPDRIEGVYLHFHGGGWTLGAIHHQDPRLEQLSERCSLAVVSVDYRLAPEHPYPAGPDDCEAAAHWLVENTTSEFGTNRLMIGGESAGAHLAVVTLLRLRDKAGSTPFCGANLVYGAYDLRCTPSARHWGERNLVLNTPIIEWFTNNFVRPELREDPDVSPLLAELDRLPPALFTVGTEDPLIDDSLFMHARWVTAGNQAELAVYPGGCHAFDALPIALGRTALDRMHEFLIACDPTGRP